jgi:hypothetical protein
MTRSTLPGHPLSLSRCMPTLIYILTYFTISDITLLPFLDVTAFNTGLVIPLGLTRRRRIL